MAADAAPGREQVDLEGPEFSPETNAIVVGYGRFGQTVAQMLHGQAHPGDADRQQASQIERVAEFGAKVYYGDGTRIDLLRTAGAETAEAILFCHDDRTFNRDKLEAVLEAFPQAAVMVRVFDRSARSRLDGLDLALIQREVFESAVAMGSAALQRLRIADREVDRVEREYRIARLRAAASGKARPATCMPGQRRSFGADRALPDEPADAGKSCG